MTLWFDDRLRYDASKIGEGWLRFNDVSECEGNRPEKINARMKKVAQVK